ncbi:MAG: hypothetical protein CMD74_02205 [Gammaproteobacteria bacterium]|nr:hypothetical protein [Gammaproteobacteria bacterium]
MPMNSTLLLIIFSMSFVLSHLVLSGPLRPTLSALLGEKGFLAVFSIIAVVSLTLLIWGYTELPRLSYFWEPRLFLLWIPAILMPFASILLTGAILSKKPKTRDVEPNSFTGANDLDGYTGIYRITRHPVQWSIIIWAVSHLVSNGDRLSVVFFSSFFLLSLCGTIFGDKRKAEQDKEKWLTIAKHTSNIPFLAILGKRNKFLLSELTQIILIGILIFFAIVWFHQYLSGVPVSFLYLDF